jgi:hypothetical protein
MESITVQSLINQGWHYCSKQEDSRWILMSKKSSIGKKNMKIRACKLSTYKQDFCSYVTKKKDHMIEHVCNKKHSTPEIKQNVEEILQQQHIRYGINFIL